MSIFRRVWFLGFALAPLVVLAACGGDGDGGDRAFELPPPGEYSFEVTGTMEIEFVEPGVSAAPLALGDLTAADYDGSIRITLRDDGTFKISKNGVELVAGREQEGAEGGALPITFTQDEEKGSTGTITEDGTKMELNVVAELATGETTTNEEPIQLEGDGDPLSDEGTTLTAADAEPVRFMPIPEYLNLELAIRDMFIEPQSFDDAESPTAEPPAADLPPDAEFTDAEGDEYECASNEGVDDGDVDVVSVGVTQVIGGVEVRVELRESPPEGQEWFSSSVQVKIGQEGRIQVGQSEVHDGTPNSGRFDDAGNFIPGSEADVVHEGKFVTIFFSGLGIEEGDTVEVRAFHLEEDGDPVHCDVTDAFPLDELIQVP